jgi:hypothetical protein
VGTSVVVVLDQALGVLNSPEAEFVEWVMKQFAMLLGMEL